MPLRVVTGIPIPQAAMALVAPGAPSVLSVAYIAQEQTNWCWAACCQMVFQFDGVAGVQQCDMATAQFGGNCCAAPSSSMCNQGNWPENTYGHYGFNCSRSNIPFTPGSLQAEIDAGRPVECYYAWAGGGAHVALICGYYPNGDLEVNDPWSAYGKGRRSYSYVLTAYGLGTWSITYSNLQK